MCMFDTLMCSHGEIPFLKKYSVNLENILKELNIKSFYPPEYNAMTMAMCQGCQLATLKVDNLLRQKSGLPVLADLTGTQHTEDYIQDLNLKIDEALQDLSKRFPLSSFRKYEMIGHRSLMALWVDATIHFRTQFYKRVSTVRFSSGLGSSNSVRESKGKAEMHTSKQASILECIGGIVQLSPKDETSDNQSVLKVHVYKLGSKSSAGDSTGVDHNLLKRKDSTAAQQPLKEVKDASIEPEKDGPPPKKVSYSTENQRKYEFVLSAPARVLSTVHASPTNSAVSDWFGDVEVEVIELPAAVAPKDADVQATSSSSSPATSQSPHSTSN